jgi:D-alanyl-D-alanine carboxypeptidase
MKLDKILAFFMVLALVVSPQDAYAKKRHASALRSRPAKHRALAGVDRTAAYADIVIDAETGQIVHDTAPDELRHPASLTKMMTLYIAFQALEAGKLSLNQYLSVSENAAAQSPSKLGVRAGQRIRAEDAILGVVTESANDAAVVLAEALGGSVESFASLMTRQAQALGMSKTRYRNPSGLPDPEQVTTAHDMAILGASLVNHFPRFYPYFSRASFNYGGVYHHNHNRLMERYDGMDGIKTGYIRASGFNLVASVKRNGRRLVAVVFGGKSAVSRDRKMAQLLDESFTAARQNPMQQASLDEGAADGDGVRAIAMPMKVAAVFTPSGQAPVAVRTASYLTPPKTMSYSLKAKPGSLKAKPVILHPPASTSKVRLGGGDWGVQIGAYSNAEVGRHALETLTSSMSGELGNPDPQVQKIAAGGIVMYRARLMSLNKKTAQNLCSYLNQRGKSCLTVEP